MTALRDDQQRALEFLQRTPRAYLAGKPGSGKTAIALALIDWLLFDRFDTRAALVVCPKRVVPQWPREAGKWIAGKDLSFTEYVGPLKARNAALRAVLSCKTNILVCSFEFLPELLKAMPLRQWPFGLVVFDEASRLRDGGRQGSVTWKAVNAISVKTSSRLLLMSGSPRPGTAHELYGPVTLLDGGQTLGPTLSQFRATYLEPDKTDRHSGRIFSWRVRRDMEPRLYEDIRHLFYALDPNLGLTSVEIDRWVQLPPAAEKACEELQRKQIAEIAGSEIVALSQGVVFGKQHQFCQGAVFAGKNGSWVEVHEEKLDELAEILKALEGESAIVCYWYEHDLARLQKRFPQAVDVATDAGLKAALAGQVQLALLHPASAGHGIDGLQLHFQNVVWFALPASFELYDQANKRLVRSGQQQTVQIFRILAANGIADRRLAQRLLSKERGQEAFFRSSKGRPSMKTNLTADIPANLQEADERMTRYGRWAMDRNRRQRCGSAEGRYRSTQDDLDRTPSEVLMHVDEALMCQRSLARVPEQERRVLTILYVPQRMSVEMQLRIAHIPARLCQERHLRGLRMFDNIFKSTF